ncbi:MAG TPA: TAXI family TRAP transporter solute-binding subunit [Gammaproteobacteria bacterium]|jgi:hypothetical protein
MRSLIAILPAALALACGPGSAVDEYRLGTADLGGAYYPLGQGIANLVTQHAGGITMVPIVTRGAIENPRLVSGGELELALTNADLAYFAHHGLPPYRMPLDIMAAGALHPSVLHLLTTARGDIRTFPELRGRRVAIGPAGGPTVTLTQLLLAAHGMTLDDIVPSFLSYSDGFSQLSDGNVDAAFALAGYPAAAVMQARATLRLRFLSIDATVLSAVTEENPYYTVVDIPREIYDTAEVAAALAVDNVLIVNAAETPEVVYDIVTAIFGHLDDLRRTNAVALQIDPERYDRLPIPLHPGALRYFAGP